MSKLDREAFKNVWPSPYVARKSVSEFSGGALSPRTLANCDSKGRGPKDRIMIGRQICYPIDSLLDWMESIAHQRG